MIEFLLNVHLYLSILLLLMLTISKLLSNKIDQRFLYRLYWFVPVLVVLATISTVFEASISFPIGEVFASGNADFTETILAQQIFDIRWLWFAGTLACIAMIAKQAHADYDIDLRQSDIKQFNGRPVYVSTSEVTGPKTIGLVNPKIILPENYNEMFDERQLQLVLEHEAIHIRRLDNIANAVAISIICLYWFNPIFWLAYWQFRQTQEGSVDQLVLEKSPSDTLVYAKALINASAPRTDHRNLSLTSSYGDANMIKQRMQFLRNSTQPSRFAKWLCAAVISSFVFASGCSTSTEEETLSTTDPVAIVSIAPRWPRAAMELGETNEVVLSYDLNSNSAEPTNIKVVSAFDTESKAQFIESAIWAMERFRFQPESTNRLELKQKFSFRLDG